MAGIAGNGHATRLGWMLELAMTATRGHQVPSIFFNHPDCFPNLHV